MTKEHPNVTVISQLNIRDLDESASLFSDDFVWHYFNPKLPDVEGNYIGVDGLKRFFAIIADKTNGTFKVKPISATPVGDELIVVQTRNSMGFEDKAFEEEPVAVDVVVVWRIVDGKITEGWDIPSLFTMAA